MNTDKTKERYVVFLRGINVGGHHKIPMSDLRNKLEELNFENVLTLLNSGNIILDAKAAPIETIERIIATHLEKTFGFPVPTIVRSYKAIKELFYEFPFQNVQMHKNIRLYVSFLKNNTATNLEIPWISDDKSLQIIDKRDNNIFSVLDLSITKTPQAMNSIEHFYGKNITTRNWKTIERIVQK